VIARRWGGPASDCGRDADPALVSAGHGIDRELGAASVAGREPHGEPVGPHDRPRRSRRRRGELDLVALEHAANLLALELKGQRSVADTEQRLRVDLADELLAGQRLEGILDRFRAMGYDRPHRVVVLAVTTRQGDGDVSFQAVRRAARDTAVGSLLVARNGRLAVLAESVADWEAFRSGAAATTTTPPAGSRYTAAACGTGWGRYDASLMRPRRRGHRF
jgi:hypothetical protein